MMICAQPNATDASDLVYRGATVEWFNFSINSGGSDASLLIKVANFNQRIKSLVINYLNMHLH